MSQTIQTVQTFITDEILHRSGGEPIPPDLNLLQEGVIDSLSLQRLIAFLETQFSITIADDDLLPENFETLAAIGRLVERSKK